MKKDIVKIICVTIPAMATIIVALITVYGNIQIANDRSKVINSQNQTILPTNSATEDDTVSKSKDVTQSIDTTWIVDSQFVESTSNRIDNQNANEPNMVAVDWKSDSYFKSYSGSGNNGFVMFGENYTNGFTMLMDASYNIWEGGIQYVTYNIKSLSKEYSSIKMFIGHIDGYASDDIKVEIFLDKSLEENPDYEYIICPNLEPKCVSIDIDDCSAMTIQVSNLGGETNCIGFADITFE
ncbi:MAG: hypothetical protein UH080_06910 [Ruminococcus sp.]|nr:hypothetical protein [Ruminococcus sp.]